MHSHRRNWKLGTFGWRLLLQQRAERSGLLLAATTFRNVRKIPYSSSCSCLRRWRLLSDMSPGSSRIQWDGVVACDLGDRDAALAGARQIRRQPLKGGHLGHMVAIGAFSSLFVLTFIRDVALLITRRWARSP